MSRSWPVRIFISPLKHKHLRDVCLESVVLEIMLVKIISIYLFIACVLLWPSKSEKQWFPVSQVFVFGRWEAWDVNALKLSDGAQQELLAMRMICYISTSVALMLITMAVRMWRLLIDINSLSLLMTFFLFCVFNYERIKNVIVLNELFSCFEYKY